eukprot:20592-Heterococcus_DN1.PRE.2
MYMSSSTPVLNTSTTFASCIMHYHTAVYVHILCIFVNSLHTGANASIEVPVSRWINVWHIQQSLPAGMQLWTDFENSCGKSGILDVQGQTAVVAQTAAIEVDVVHTNTCSLYTYGTR